VAALQGECLKRDRYRRVISGRFDDAEARKRVEREGDDEAKDDDGHKLKSEAGTKTALTILNMFDDGILHLIEGSEIDRPRNALTLTHDFRQLFGNFEVYFEAAPDIPHTYKIDTTRSGILRNPIFPLTRTLHLTTTRTIDPPSPRFLAIHRAITLHQSAAGDYIDGILEHLDLPKWDISSN